MKKWLSFALIVCLLLSGCEKTEECAQQTVFCMDTVMDIRIWGNDRDAAMADVVQMLRDLEKTWSATDENSFLSALNRGTATPDTQQQAVLDAAVALQQRTNGAFDPKLGSLVALWGFYDDQHQVPSTDQLQLAMVQPRWDLGGLIKGYAGTLAVEILDRYDVDRAILNLGGNVQTYGEKAEGQPWNVGIQNPSGGDSLGVLAVSGSMAVVTSGDYQRYFELDGVRYHHILDPDTGHPADSALRSVTVICADGTAADALSTALFVMGWETAADYWRGSSDFEAVFVLTDGRIYATEGAMLSGCEFEVICREN